MDKEKPIASSSYPQQQTPSTTSPQKIQTTKSAVPHSTTTSASSSVVNNAESFSDQQQQQQPPPQTTTSSIYHQPPQPQQLQARAPTTAVSAQEVSGSALPDKPPVSARLSLQSSSTTTAAAAADSEATGGAQHPGGGIKDKGGGTSQRVEGSTDSTAASATKSAAAPASAVNISPLPHHQHSTTSSLSALIDHPTNIVMMAAAGTASKAASATSAPPNTSTTVAIPHQAVTASSQMAPPTYGASQSHQLLQSNAWGSSAPGSTVGSAAGASAAAHSSTYGIPPSTINKPSHRQGDTIGSQNKGISHRPAVFDKLEQLVRDMQDNNHGVPVRSQKLFLTSIPAAFMGYDLIEWLMDRLSIEDSLEAVHLANLLCQFGYYFPVNELKNLIVKDDSSLYRFQTPYYWPSQHHTPDNIEYAIYLTKRTQRNKQKHGLEDYETEANNNLKKILVSRWDFVQMQAEEQLKVNKDRKKGDKIITDSQEKAYWRVYRPPPGFTTVVESSPVPTREQRIKARSRTREHITEESEFLQSYYSMRSRWKVSQAVENLLEYTELFSEFDPVLSPVNPSNPWLTDEQSFWIFNASLVDCPTEKRVKKWAISLEDLINDPQGVKELMDYMKKEYSHENLRFWLSVQELRTGPGSEAKIKKKVKEIWDEFLSPGAKAEINIDGKTMEATKTAMKGQASRYTFEDAAQHVYTLLLKKDCYPRFTKSEHYKALLANSLNPGNQKKKFPFTFNVKKKTSVIQNPGGGVTGTAQQSSNLGRLGGYEEIYGADGAEELLAGAGARTLSSHPSRELDDSCCPWEVSATTPTTDTQNTSTTVISATAATTTVSSANVHVPSPEVEAALAGRSSTSSLPRPPKAAMSSPKIVSARLSTSGTEVERPSTSGRSPGSHSHHHRHHHEHHHHHGHHSHSRSGGVGGSGGQETTSCSPSSTQAILQQQTSLPPPKTTSSEIEAGENKKLRVDVEHEDQQTPTTSGSHGTNRANKTKSRRSGEGGGGGGECPRHPDHHRHHAHHQSKRAKSKSKRKKSTRSKTTTASGETTTTSTATTNTGSNNNGSMTVGDKENISEVAVSVEPIVIETPTPMVGNTEKNNTSASGSATSKLHKHNKLHSRSSSPLKATSSVDSAQAQNNQQQPPTSSKCTQTKLDLQQTGNNNASALGKQQLKQAVKSTEPDAALTDQQQQSMVMDSLEQLQLKQQQDQETIAAAIMPESVVEGGGGGGESGGGVSTGMAMSAGTSAPSACVPPPQPPGAGATTWTNPTDVCPWEDEENKKESHAPFVKTYATLGYL